MSSAVSGALVGAVVERVRLELRQRFREHRATDAGHRPRRRDLDGVDAVEHRQRLRARRAGHVKIADAGSGAGRDIDRDDGFVSAGLHDARDRHARPEIDVGRLQRRRSWGYDRIFAVTMNHSVWFHRPIRFDDWVLYSTSSPVASESRGLGTGHFFDRSGQLLATVVQEGIVKYFPGTKS